MYQLAHDDKIKVLTSIEIKGKLTDIWDVLMDLDHWDKWTEHIAIVEGKFGKDEWIKVLFNTPDGKVYFDRQLVIFEYGRVFCWEGESMFPGLKDHHVFYLEERDEDKVCLVHADGFHGKVRPQEVEDMEKQMKILYEIINEDLKNYIENNENHH